MALGVLGDDTPEITIDDHEEPAPEVHDASVHEDMPQPSSPVLHPKSSAARKPPQSGPVTHPSQVRQSTTGSSFPWWLVIVILVMSEGKKRK